MSNPQLHVGITLEVRPAIHSSRTTVFAVANPRISDFDNASTTDTLATNQQIHPGPPEADVPRRRSWTSASCCPLDKSASISVLQGRCSAVVRGNVAVGHRECVVCR